MRNLLAVLILLALACGAILPDPRFGGDEYDCPDMCQWLQALGCTPWWPADTGCVDWCVAIERDPERQSLCPRWVTGALDCGQAERAKWCGRR